MKIDLHTHCLPVSRCAHHERELLPQIVKDANGNNISDKEVEN